MRGEICAAKNRRCFWELTRQRDGYGRSNGRDVLLIRTRFAQRLNRWPRPFVRCRTTSFVCATAGLARLLAGRIRHKTRRRSRQANCRRQKRQPYRKGNRDLAEHHPFYSTSQTFCRSGGEAQRAELLWANFFPPFFTLMSLRFSRL